MLICYITDLLLHCDEAIVVPSITTSGKGEPLAKMARPPVAAWACSAVHSDREVGLESGKMMGAVSGRA